MSLEEEVDEKTRESPSKSPHADKEFRSENPRMSISYDTRGPPVACQRTELLQSPHNDRNVYIRSRTDAVTQLDN